MKMKCKGDAGIQEVASLTKLKSPTDRNKASFSSLPGKQLVHESYTNDKSHDDGDDNNGYSNDDGDYRIVFRAQEGPYDSSGSRAAYVDAQDSATANADVLSSGAANDEGTRMSVRNEQVLESQIMLSERSRTASVDGGEGMLSQLDAAGKRVEVGTESYFKRYSGSHVKAFDKTYTRRKKLKESSAPPPVAPVHPAILSEAETDYHIKSIVVKELGIRFTDKGSGENILPLIQQKQYSHSRIPTKQVETAKASSNVSGTRSHVSSPREDDSCDMASSQKKVRKAVRKVSYTKARTSPQFRATSSHPPQQGAVHIKEPHMATSPNVIAQAGVMHSPTSAEAAATYEGASDVPAVTTPIVYGEVVDQLAAGTTIATTVVNLVDVAVFTEAETFGVVTAPPVPDAAED